MARKFVHKLVFLPAIIAILAVIGIFGAKTLATNDIVTGGKLWKPGLSFWEPSISVEPGMDFKITLYASNFSSTETFTNLTLTDQLPQYASYIPASTYQLDAAGAWQAFADDGTSPFDGSGMVPTSGGTLAPFSMANFKYAVHADDFLPTGTTALAWSGPALQFTDASGSHTINNVESVSIGVINLPTINSLALSPASTHYKLGDVITGTVIGTAGKTSSIKIGAITVSLTESASGIYVGSYTVQASDNLTALPRAYLANANGKGAYKDSTQSITIDSVLPPAPTGLIAALNPDMTVNLSWTAPADVSDVNHYNIYSNNGSGNVNYATPLTTVAVGTNQFTTTALTTDVLYKFAVRSVDAVGNIETNAIVVSKSTDVTPPEPPASLVAPTSLNNTVLKFSVISPIQFVWASSPAADLAKYRLEIDDNSDFSSIITSQDTVGTTTSYSLPTSTISLPDGLYFWRVLAIDDVDLVSTPAITPDNSFEVDNINPAVTVSLPASGARVGGNFTASGTGSDSGTHLGATNGLAKVEVFLTDLTAGKHWNGTAWVGTATFLLTSSADNFTNWNYNFTATITNGHSYITGARITDKAGNTTDSGLIALLGDTTAPSISVTSPAPGSFIGGNITLSGIASDVGGGGISDVALSIERSSDNHFWNGTDWTATSAVWNTATSTTSFLNWSYAFNPDLSATPDNTTYTVVARAKDSVVGAPNQTSTPNFVLTKDSTAPIVALTAPLAASSPYNSSTWVTAHPVRGTATDAGSGVAGVEVAIKDSANKYWDGSAWSSDTAVWFSATSADSFATWKYIAAGSDFIPNKNDSFTVYARGTDKSLGQAATSAPVLEAIIYDTTAPIVAGVTITNTTISSTTLMKDGQNIILTATITDALGQASMTTANISANLSSITNNIGDIALVPTSYNNVTGLATWAAVTSASTGDGARGVTVTASDPAANSGNGNGSITADNTVPTILSTTLTSPSAIGISWAGSGTQNITWSQAHITDTHLAANPITLEYTTDGSTWNPIATNEANDGSYAWSVPALNSQTVKVRITAKDDAGNTSTDSSNNDFTIDSTLPTVPAAALTAPNGSEAWKQGTSRTVTWNNVSITDNFGLAANPITLEYTTDGATWNPIASNEANDGTYNWTTPVVDSTTVKVRITASDAAGNTANDQSDNNFSIGLPPTIVQARAVGNTTIEVEWDKALSSAGAFANYTATGITTTAAAVNGGNNKIVDLTVDALNNTGFTVADLAIALNTVTDTFNFQNEAASGKAIVDKQAPQITTHKLMSLVGNDYMVINFSENVATTSAQTIANYNVESPTTNTLNISGSTLTYANKKIIAQLASGLNLTRTNSYQITLNSIADLSSNNIATNTQINGTVTGALTISEIISDPQLDWTSTDFTTTPTSGFPADIGDRFIELYSNESGLDLRDWTIQLGRTYPTGGGPNQTISGSFVVGGTAAPIFSGSSWRGSGSVTNTAVGSTLVLSGSSFNSFFEDPDHGVLSTQVVVKDENGIIVDQVAIGAFNDGNTGDNAYPVTQIPAQPLHIYQEGITRDHNLTDTNNDEADWHVTQATPGVIDVTAPAFNMTNTYPGQNQLIVDTAPRLVIPLTETESGIRWSTQVTLKIDGVNQTVSMDLTNHIIYNIPGAPLAYGKHTVTVDVADNANNIAPTQTWDFWIDSFATTITTAPINFIYNGNTTDETSAGERQQITVSTFGAGFKVYALFQPDFGDGAGNFITDVDMKLAADPWTNKIDLNRTNQVQLASVAKAGVPSLSAVETSYTFDLRATIDGVIQAAGNYSGTLQFIIVPEY